MWRIARYTDGYKTEFVVQKRLFGFLWWYTPYNTEEALLYSYDEYFTGRYSTQKEAEEALTRMVSVPTYETVRALSDYLEENAKGVAR